jgi:UDP-N-acetylglucosamine 2-epimerase (non-hydrolysing)
LREGVAASRIHFVGNVMIDTLHHNLKQAVPPLQILQLAGKGDFLNGRAEYAVLTLHRPSNVDDAAILKNMLLTVREISLQVPVIFPMHPRTRTMIEQFSLKSILAVPSILDLPPIGYLEMLGLMKDARLVLTDSGGIQEETTALGVPCITLRNNTERPITVDEGTNTVVGQDPNRILAAFDDIVRQGGKAGRIPELWDGRASLRIAEVMHEWLSGEAGKLYMANSN